MQRMTLSRLEGAMRPKALWNVGRALLHGQETSVFDLRNTMRGFRFSLDAMWTEASRLNLNERVPALQMPVFYFLGRHDHWVPGGDQRRQVQCLMAELVRPNSAFRRVAAQVLSEVAGVKRPWFVSRPPRFQKQPTFFVPNLVPE